MYISQVNEDEDCMRHVIAQHLETSVTLKRDTSIEGVIQFGGVVFMP